MIRRFYRATVHDSRDSGRIRGQPHTLAAMSPWPYRFPTSFLFLALVVLMAAPCVFAQTTVIQPENIRMDYAQVLSVQPVYQTLRATRMEQRCEPPLTRTQEDTQSKPRGLSRIVGTVKGIFGGEQPPAAIANQQCEQVEVKREFTRPIAYDVDYVYKGAKYRSRLPYDPGHKIKIKVSVTPMVITSSSD